MYISSLPLCCRLCAAYSLCGSLSLSTYSYPLCAACWHSLSPYTLLSLYKCCVLKKNSLCYRYLRDFIKYRRKKKSVLLFSILFYPDGHDGQRDRKSTRIFSSGKSTKGAILKKKMLLNNVLICCFLFVSLTCAFVIDDKMLQGNVPNIGSTIFFFLYFQQRQFVMSYRINLQSN